MNTDYSISDLSREFEVTPRTLRYYEEKGILAPLRKGQTRVYSTADRAHLILILRGKQLGLSLQESADLISMYDPATNNKRQLELLIGKIRAQRLHLQNQKEELERMIVDLEAWEHRSIVATQGPSTRHSKKSKSKAPNQRELT